MLEETVKMRIYPDFVVLISANAEWRVIRKSFRDYRIKHSPYGEWFTISYGVFPDLRNPVVFIQGGWGKVAAGASTQYVINRWHPRLIINLGTCGGFEGEILKGEIILVEKTIIYDIYEQMGDPEEHIRHYATDIDISWLDDPLPLQVKRTVLVSGDRDLFCDDIPSLKSKYGAIAGDWESGAIAWVANKNHTQCLIIRGVTDMVGETGGEAYDGNVNNYYENTWHVMKKLIESLPKWLLKYTDHPSYRELKK
jgi:adenosylhomocysteine nucleosidase